MRGMSPTWRRPAGHADLRSAIRNAVLAITARASPSSVAPPALQMFGDRIDRRPGHDRPPDQPGNRRAPRRRGGGRALPDPGLSGGHPS